MKYIDETYALLKEAKLVSSYDELSTRFLLKNPSYIRAGRAMKRELSISAQASLASRLHQIAEDIKASKLGDVFGTGQKLGDLSDELWAGVYQRSLQPKKPKRTQT